MNLPNRPGKIIELLQNIKVNDGLLSAFSMTIDLENVKDMKTIGRARLLQKDNG